MPTITGTESRYQDQLMKVGALQIGGTPIYPGFPISGNTFFVSPHLGNDNFDGSDWDSAVATFDALFDKDNFVSGSVVYFNGKVREQVTTPAGVFDVTIIGTGNRPRHADAHTTNGGYSAATWMLPASGAVAATPALRIQQQGWRLMNFLMQADTSQVCVDLYRDGGAGDAERDASHFSCYGMRFDGAGIGIRDNGGCNFVGIYDSFFRGQTTAIANITGAGIGTMSFWEVVGNKFIDNTNHAVIPISHGLVKGNMFMTFTTIGLNSSGGTAGKNTVTENVMFGDYDAGFVAHADDFWFNNHSLDTASGEVDADGKTSAVPAA
jgi:hypothetical protein